MSGPLVSQPSSSGFSQQGQVDWVELSSKSVQFSVAVLARLSRAGVDVFTIQVARAICLSFSLGPVGQERITDAISKLRRYGSYQSLMWFGFGVKHVVSDLAETEQGLTFVALCAALTAIYDLRYSARVLRELCVLQNAPQSFTPALRQWQALVQLCSGILTSSQFLLILNGFRRLMSSNTDDSRYRHHPTEYQDLAKAILTLGRISRIEMVNATFTGGLDCAWLAALAEWVLSLDVMILSSSGLSLYRSRAGASSLPQVTIVCSTAEAQEWQANLHISRAFVLPSGQAIVHHDRMKGSLVNWRSSFSSVLHDTFCEDTDRLLKGVTGHHFATYFECVSMTRVSHSKLKYQERHRTGLTNSNPVYPFFCTPEASRNHELLRNVSRTLPEIAHILDPELPILDEANVHQLGQDSLNAISATCLCRDHQNRNQEDGKENFCLNSMARTIVVFLWIVLSSSIDDDVCPSINGLKELYSWAPISSTVDHNVFSWSRYTYGIELVAGVFIGVTEPFRNRAPSLAWAGEGLCVYRTALDDPNLPPKLVSRYRIIRGYIAYSGACFNTVTSLPSPVNDYRPSDQHNYLFDTSPPISIDAILREGEGHAELELWCIAKYLGEDKKICDVWLDFGMICDRLRCDVTTVRCSGRCNPLYELERSPFSFFSWRNSMNPRLKFDKNAVDIAQQAIQEMRHTEDTWILSINRTGKNRRIIYNSHFIRFVNNPIHMYIFLSDSSNYPFSLITFTKCLSCLIELGSWARPLKRTEEARGVGELPSKGKVTLLIPGTERREFEWATEGLENEALQWVDSANRQPSDSGSSNSGSGDVHLLSEEAIGSESSYTPETGHHEDTQTPSRSNLPLVQKSSKPRASFWKKRFWGHDKHDSQDGQNLWKET